MAFLSGARHKAPAFKAEAVIGQDFKSLTLDDLTADNHYVVLVFYPADWTFICPTEVQAYSDAAPQFAALKARVAACSVDSVHSHLAWINTAKGKGGLGPMQIPVISDITKSIARSFGVLVEDPADDMCGLALRATFVVDGRGVVRSVTDNDAPVGRSVDETLRLVQAFRYTDEHGEVCPAGWKPGAKTMVAEPAKSKAYFAEVHGACSSNGGAAAPAPADPAAPSASATGTA